MKCSKTRAKLLDYVYGELEPQEAVRVEQHVSECADCADALRELEFTRKVFRNAEARVPSNHAVESLCRAAADAPWLKEPQEKKRRIIPLFSAEVLRPFLAGAASVMILIGMATWIFQPRFTEGKIQPQLQDQNVIALNPAMERNLITQASMEKDWNNPDRVVEVLLQSSRQREAAMRTSLNLVLPAMLKPDDPRAPLCIFKAADTLYQNECPYEAFLLYRHLDGKYGDFERNYEVSRRLGDILSKYGRTKGQADKYYDKAEKQWIERDSGEDA